MKSNYTSLTLKFILILCICNMSPLNSQTLLKNNDPLSSEALLSNNLSSNTQMLPACAQALGAGQLLCYNRNTDGTMTVFLAQGTVIRQKILDKNGATLSTTTMGSIAQDSVLVKNNQVIKKLANGTIAFTKNIPPSVLSLFPTINAAVEMSDGTFVLGGFQKIIASNNGVPFSRDSLVLVSTDVNLNLQNVTIEVPRSELGFVSTVALDSLLQLMPMPNNRFLAIYNFGISAIVTSNNLVFSIFQKTGTSLSKEKTNTFAGHTFKNQPSRTTLCGNNLMFEARIKNVGQKGSYSGTSAYIFNLDSVFVVTEKRVGSGNTSNFGNYNSYFYNHRPTLRDTAFQISANYAGDPRIGLNDFLSLEVKFYNNSATATHSKIMPFVQYDHIMRTGDTTLLVLGSENGEIWVFNPDCNATQAALPDLTLANLNDVTPSVAQGQILKFKVDIKNIGADSTKGNFTIKTYISKDNVLSADDIQDGIIPTANYQAGFSVLQVLGAVTIPETLSAGQYYLIVKVDADNQIVESDENNNILVSTTPFTVTSIQNFDYCVSKSITPWELWVSNVKFVSINNTSEKFKDYATLGYSDYTNLSTPIQKGQMYQLSIAPGMSWIGNLPNAYCRVWIDFNNNKIFEDSELVFQNTNVDPFVSAIRIPLTASTGNVRMRISVKLGSYPTACETFDIGEVEDYLLQITEGGDTTGKPDLVSNISATAALYKQWTNDTFKISLKNTGNQVFTDIKMQFSYPPKTATGGMATPSMGIWQEYCAGGSRCFMWTIPSIEANSTATLHVPLYVLDATGVMSATTKLLSSTPIDNIVVNNTATVTLNPVPMSAPQPLVVQKALHLKPLSIQPTISADMVFVEIESLIEKTVDFTIFNTVGKPVQREKYTLEKGYNRLTFDIAQLPKGLYFIQPATNTAHLKFIKM